MFLKKSPDRLPAGCPKSNAAVKEDFFCVSAPGPHALHHRDSCPRLCPTRITPLPAAAERLLWVRVLLRHG